MTREPNTQNGAPLMCLYGQPALKAVQPVRRKQQAEWE